MLYDTPFDWSQDFVTAVYDKIPSGSVLLVEHPVGETALAFGLRLAALYSREFKTLFFTSTGLGVEHFIASAAGVRWMKHEIWRPGKPSLEAASTMLESAAEIVVVDLFVPGTYPNLATLLTTQRPPDVGMLVVALVPSLEEIASFLSKRGVTNWGTYAQDKVYTVSVHGLTGVPQIEKWRGKA